jgi:hypothetical protein
VHAIAVVVSAINEVVIAIEAYVATLALRGTKPVDLQVRASGDDVDVIKVWVDLGPSSVDAADWATACEAAIKQTVPGATAFRIQVRAEKL